MQHSIVSNANGDDSNLVVVVPGQGMILAHSSHPGFRKAVEALNAAALGDAPEPTGEWLREVLDPEAAVTRRFEAVSDRVQVGNGVVLFDGAEVDSSVAKQILRFLEEDEDFKPLVNFLEKVMDNPEPHSREQLFDWLQRHDFTLTSEGNIVGYKGVRSDGKGGYESISRGRERVLVNGEPHTGAIPNPIGAVVNMDRSLVEHDPAVGCHVGLHVGTYEYASSFGSVLLEVEVNPRDVVSVPTDCGWQKVRTCRYKVVGLCDGKYDAPLRPLEEDGTDLDGDGWSDLDDDFLA